MSLTIAAMPADDEIARMVLGCKKHVDRLPGRRQLGCHSRDSCSPGGEPHERNMGYGAALRSCFEAARRMGAERMVIIDSDGQHDASDIPRLLSPLKHLPGCPGVNASTTKSQRRTK